MWRYSRVSKSSNGILRMPVGYVPSASLPLLPCPLDYLLPLSHLVFNLPTASVKYRYVLRRGFQHETDSEIWLDGIWGMLPACRATPHQHQRITSSTGTFNLKVCIIDVYMESWKAVSQYRC
jgi:hypothetical protein